MKAPQVSRVGSAGSTDGRSGTAIPWTARRFWSIRGRKTRDLRTAAGYTCRFPRARRRMWKIGASGKRTHEDACEGGGDRRRGRRRQHALPSDEEGLVRRDAARAHGAHGGIDVARRRAPAALQHELHGRPAAQVFGRPLQAPAGGDRAGGQLPRHRQPAPRDVARPDGRVSQVLRHREHDRRAVPDHHAGGSGRAVAAREPGRRRRHAEDRRRALPSGRRPHRAGRSHDGAAARRALGRRRDLRADRGAAHHPHARRANGRSRRTRATSSASTSSARPATMRARPDGSSASTCRRSRSSTSTSSTTSPRS